MTIFLSPAALRRDCGGRWRTARLRATPAALADAVQQWLTPEAAPQVAAVQQRFAALHQSLLRDTSTLAAQAIETLIYA